jgi:hypothetical protein
MSENSLLPNDNEQDGWTCFDLAFASVATALIIIVIVISGLFYFAAPHAPEVIVPAGDCLNHICM